MDFFGNVQGVEVEGGLGANDSEWKEDLRRLSEIARRRKDWSGNGIMNATEDLSMKNARELKEPALPARGQRTQGAAKVEVGMGWGQQVVGAWALLGCALLLGGASWLESSR